MITYLLFSAMIQCYVIFAFLVKRISFKVPGLLMFTIFVFSYAMVLTKWVLHQTYSFHNIYVDVNFFPDNYIFAPTIYFFVRFSIQPSTLFSKKWLAWYLPAAIDTGLILLHLAFRWVDSGIADKIYKAHQLFIEPSLYFFCLGAIVTLFFVVQKRINNKISVIYKNQLLYIYGFVLFVLLFVLAELATPPGEGFYTFLTMSGFTFCMNYVLINNTKLFAKDNIEGTELLKTALNESSKAVMILDARRTICFTNDAFVKLTGYAYREIVGRKSSFLQGSLTTNEQVIKMERYLDDQIPFEIEIINYRKNGEAYVCKMAITPVFYDHKQTHFIAFVDDIKTIAAPEIELNEQQLIARVKSLLEQDELYLDKHLQLGDVAERLKVPPRKLSETLKKIENVSFNVFINKYRVQAAISMLSDPEFEQWTMEAIGSKAGFNSKASFYTAFKELTGKTPSNFVKHL